MTSLVVIIFFSLKKNPWPCRTPINRHLVCSIKQHIYTTKSEQLKGKQKKSAFFSLNVQIQQYKKVMPLRKTFSGSGQCFTLCFHSNKKGNILYKSNVNLCKNFSLFKKVDIPSYLPNHP